MANAMDVAMQAVVILSLTAIFVLTGLSLMLGDSCLIQVVCILGQRAGFKFLLAP